MPAIQINTPFNLALDFEVAPLHKRIIAYAADVVIMIVYSWGVRKFIYGFFDVPVNTQWGTNFGVDIAFVSIPMLLYVLI
jgi:hypothetical protein